MPPFQISVKSGAQISVAALQQSTERSNSTGETLEFGERVSVARTSRKRPARAPPHRDWPLATGTKLACGRLTVLSAARISTLTEVPAGSCEFHVTVPQAWPITPLSLITVHEPEGDVVAFTKPVMSE
jgi:hypothetical protein